jgi:hypothetical protein
MKNIIKVKFFLYFFNKYKFFLFIKSLKYYIKTFNFKFRRQFLLYWIRFYKYSLTRFLVNIEYCLVKYFNYIKKQYNSFNSLINIKKTKENIYIFFCFFYNQYKDVFLTNYKIAPLISASKLLKFNYIEKNNFSLFFFKIIKKNIILIYLKNLKKLKILFKIKFLIFLKNYIFLILLQYLISWFNYYILTLKGFNIYRSMIVDYFKCKYTKTENLFFGLNIINSYKWNSLSFLSFNYFFFNNMVIKKKWWNW